MLLLSCLVMSYSLRPHGLQHCQASLSFIISWSLLKLMSIESMIPYNHLLFCRPLLLPSVFPRIRIFSNESALCITWPKYCSFSFSISPSNEYSGLISWVINKLGNLTYISRFTSSLCPSGHINLLPWVAKTGKSWLAAAPSLGKELGAALKFTTPYHSQY